MKYIVYILQQPKPFRELSTLMQDVHDSLTGKLSSSQWISIHLAKFGQCNIM